MTDLNRSRLLNQVWDYPLFEPSFDKQPLRDFLEAERLAGRWNGDAPAPPLLAEIVQATSQRYLEAFRRITGSALHSP